MVEAMQEEETFPWTADQLDRVVKRSSTCRAERWEVRSDGDGDGRWINRYADVRATIRPTIDKSQTSVKHGIDARVESKSTHPLLPFDRAQSLEWLQGMCSKTGISCGSPRSAAGVHSEVEYMLAM